MARRKKNNHAKLKSKLVELAHKVTPEQILDVLAKVYKKFPNRKRQNDPEYEYWIKISRSTENLASGMHKWLTEWIDEEEEEREGE